MPVFIADEAGLKKSRLTTKIINFALEELGLKGSEVSVLITGDEGMRALNKKFRRIDKPTDVLSFPMDESGMLGDIAISVDKVVLQAKEFGVSFEEELARLLIHGLLHLIGYDHVKGGRQAAKMKAKEAVLLNGLKKNGLV
ncbi:rRNA maturation RNase YbeY [bacterium]|nr:MAG: rRNA maturation RNase YbeY [bacterium]